MYIPKAIRLKHNCKIWLKIYQILLQLVNVGEKAAQSHITQPIFPTYSPHPAAFSHTALNAPQLLGCIAVLFHGIAYKMINIACFCN